jgi:hypothetical protein
MPHPSNALTFGSLSQVSATASSGAAAAGSAPRPSPDVLTYSYASRMVYVTPGDTYDVRPFPSTTASLASLLIDLNTHVQQAIDIAKESFLELKDVQRELISLEVHVVLKNQQVRRTAEIGRTAWPVVVASLARFEIVEIRVTSVPTTGKAAVALSSSQASTVEPPPYVSEKGWYSDSQMDSHTPYRPQISGSQSHSPSFATRVVDLLTPKTSRGRLSPQPFQL